MKKIFKQMDKSINDLNKAIEETTGGTTGFFVRINTKTFKEFNSKEALSEFKRQEIIEKLLDQYNEKGDNIFNILNTNPF